MSFSAKFPKAFSAYILSAMVAFASPMTVLAAGRQPAAAVKPEPTLPEASRLLLENVRTKNDVLGILATAGVSIEASKIIETDLDRRLPKNMQLPKMTIVKDEVQVEGKSVGVKILSYDPVRIKYHGLVWTRDGRKSTEDNYFSLVKIFEPQKKARLFMDLFVPSAQAFFSTGWSGALSGGLIGAFAGAMLGMATGGSAIQGALAFGGMGAVFGFVYGRNNEDQQRLKSQGYIN